MTIAYKLVREVDGVLRSLQHGCLKDLSITYTAGQLVVPLLPWSKLFCFDTLASARKAYALYFSSCDSWNVQLWSADADIYTPGPTEYVPDPWCSRTVMEAYWSARRQGLPPPWLEDDQSSVPDGTVLVNSVTLLERIDLA